MLAVACPRCGAPNTADSKFCGDCGTVLAGSVPAGPAGTARAAGGAAAAVESAPVAERRHVTVVFADLVGFTTISEGRDPEETRELLTRYFTLARDVIGRHGGNIEKFIGDAVMAVWGAPIAREDDAERAVRAALELVDAVKSLGLGIQARAGVLTGEAAVTIGATGEGMVAGDLVNTASRLQSVAPPGAVLVGEATERAANQAISFEAAGEQLLKGKAAPVPAYRALRVVAEMGGRNRAGGLEAPFVGRDDDFRLLKDLFHATGRDKRPRLVSIMGPAGIGKSRLAWEFSKYSDGLVEDTYWHAGRNPSYGDGITFWALGEMVRRRAELLETDDEATTRAKVAQTVEQWEPDAGQRHWIETALLALLGLGEALPGGRDELFAAWRTFFERIAEQGTTVLLFEDLQWADSGLLDFIDHLLNWTKALPIFVITLSRPELLERRPEWGAGHRNFVSLSLEPLAEEHMNELLDGLVPGLPGPVRGAIVARADGMPLYAVETVRMLVADGKLREEGGAYIPIGDLSKIAIPETLNALIAARLDALDAPDRSIVQAAAVLGQSFTLAALEALTSVDENALKPTLDAFVRRELFTVDIDPRSPERGQYAFMQALIREVAYNQLARNDRKTRHLAAARWFESLGDDELAGVLAGHYAAAHRNAAPGPEADALATQARIALRGAAERAAKLGSHAQAVSFLLQALETTEEPAERAALLERAGREAEDATPDGSRVHFEQAMDLYRSLGDLHGIARCGTGISVALQSLYRPADAVPVLEAAVAETAAIEGQPDAILLLSELARAYANTRDPRALELVDRVLERAEPLELMPIIVEGLINRALVLTYAGRYYEPTTLLRGVLPIADAHGLRNSQMRAMNNLSVSLMIDDYREAAELTNQGVELARRIGALGSMVWFQGGLIVPLIFMGRWAEADALIEQLHDANPADANMLDYFEALAVYDAIHGRDEQAAALLEEMAPTVAQSSLGDVAAQHGWVEAAVAALGGRLEDAQAHGTRGMLAPASAGAVVAAEWALRSALWSGDARRAREALDAMDKVRLPGRVLNAIRLVARASVDALEGRSVESLAGFQAGIAIWRDLELPLYRILALVDLAIAHDPSEPAAKAAAEEARELLTRFDSPPLRARLEEGLARWPAAARATGREARPAHTAKKLG